MPMYKGHLAGGLVAYLLVILLVSVWYDTFTHNLNGLLAALAGALFPDIDIRSKGQRLFLTILFLCVVLCLFLQATVPLVFLLFFSVLPIVFPHRGLFHDLTFVAALSLCVAGSLIVLLPDKTNTIGATTLFFLVGVISHLGLDKGFKKTFYY